MDSADRAGYGSGLRRVNAMSLAGAIGAGIVYSPAPAVRAVPLSRAIPPYARDPREGVKPCVYPCRPFSPLPSSC